MIRQEKFQLNSRNRSSVRVSLRTKCRNDDNNFERLFSQGEPKSDQQLKGRYEHTYLSLVTEKKLSVSIIFYNGIDRAVERVVMVTW